MHKERRSFVNLLIHLRIQFNCLMPKDFTKFYYNVNEIYPEYPDGPALYPDIRRLFMSDLTANVIAHHGTTDEGVHLIQKPFTMQELSERVRKALDDY